MPVTDCDRVGDHSPWLYMIDQATKLLNAAGDWLYAGFVMPGSYLIAKFVAVAPVTAMRLDLSADQPDVTLLIMLSLISWVVLLVLLYFCWRIVRNCARVANAFIRTGLYRLKAALSSYKTKLVLTLRALLPRRSGAAENETPAVEFDELDLAILHSVSAQGPGFTLSAPELAERLSLLPSQIQLSLDKLNRSNMLKSVIGSTDGFDNYRMSESGAAFVSMCQRQEARG